MRRLHPTAPQRQGRHAPARAQPRDRRRRADDVGDGVPGADFVKADRVDRPAVHAGFGVGEPGEDRDRALAHRRRERRGRETGAQICPAHVSMPHMRVRGGCVLMLMRVFMCM